MMPAARNTTRTAMIARVAWIVARLLLVLWMGERGLAFYYQGF